MTYTATDKYLDRQIHVTRISGSGEVYGHSLRHCDPSGCADDEHYYSEIRADDATVGDVVDTDDDCSAASCAGVPAPPPCSLARSAIRRVKP